MDAIPAHRGEETRGRILQAAETCFAQHGYDGTGVAEICQVAGISKGAFYHHFPTKQAVFLALLGNWLAGLDVLIETIRAQTPNVPAALIQMADLLHHVFDSAAGRLPVLLDFWLQAGRDPVTWKAAVEPYQHYRAMFASLMEAGVAEGSLRPVDPQAAAQALLSLVLGLAMQGVFDPHGADWGEVAKSSIRMLLAGLALPETPDSTRGTHP